MTRHLELGGQLQQRVADEVVCSARRRPVRSASWLMLTTLCRRPGHHTLFMAAAAICAFRPRMWATRSAIRLSRCRRSRPARRSFRAVLARVITDTASRAMLQLLDDLFDLLGGFVRTVGECPDLVRHHRKAAAFSPARAASMAAFRASRLVCSAIDLITSRTPPTL